MSFAVSEVLLPVSQAEPLGPALRHLDEFAVLKTLVNAPTKVNWAQVKDIALDLARRVRDVRVWVWFTRASLVTDDLPGFASGLDLIGRGLERYWETIEPIDPDTPDPRERFLGRVMALAELGVTSFQANLEDLTRSGRAIVDLRADLDRLVARTVPNEATRLAIDGCRAAIRKIEDIFRAGFGPRADPQLGFELVLSKLAAIEPKFGAPMPTSKPTAGNAMNGHASAAIGQVATRDDVLSVLNLVLEYYETHEPCSPVPLLVARAKRLVSMSFLDALKDLAPGGMKELQAIAGTVEDSGK
jgi:type VI secretion system protein ImpA